MSTLRRCLKSSYRPKLPIRGVEVFVQSLMLCIVCQLSTSNRRLVSTVTYLLHLPQNICRFLKVGFHIACRKGKLPYRFWSWSVCERELFGTPFFQIPRRAHDDRRIGCHGGRGCSDDCRMRGGSDRQLPQGGIVNGLSIGGFGCSLAAMGCRYALQHHLARPCSRPSKTEGLATQALEQASGSELRFSNSDVLSRWREKGSGKGQRDGDRDRVQRSLFSLTRSWKLKPSFSCADREVFYRRPWPNRSLFGSRVITLTKARSGGRSEVGGKDSVAVAQDTGVGRGKQKDASRNAC